MTVEVGVGVTVEVGVGVSRPSLTHLSLRLVRTNRPVKEISSTGVVRVREIIKFALKL